MDPSAVLSEAATSVLLRLVETSSIALPRDVHDVTGRFSRVLSPTHLTKEQALEVVDHPPGDGEPMPVGPRPGQP